MDDSCCICTEPGTGDAKIAACISGLHIDLTLRHINKKTDSTGDSSSSRPWVESDVCRLTAKCNNILSKSLSEQFTR